MISRLVGINLAVAVACCGATLRAQEQPVESLQRQYWTDARTYSLLPDDELATYRSYGGGGVGPTGSLGLGVSTKQRQFNVSIEPRVKDGRFLAKISVEPDKEDKITQAQSTQYDLSNLEPRTLEVARDDDGRVYRLSLVPRIIETPQPQQFAADDLRLDYWSFPSSPIVLNDQDYLGRLAMSSGPIASCDIPGLAKIEFSLLHLTNAEPLGVLKDGTITITHGGSTLRISDVKNAAHRDVLAGGPYRVWVRWQQPSQTVDEYRASMTQYIAKLRERIDHGELSLPPGRLEHLEEMAAAGRIGISENGLRGVEPGEVVQPGDTVEPK